MSRQHHGGKNWRTGVIAFAVVLASAAALAGWSKARAQSPVTVDPHIQIVVDMVQLNVAVTDNQGISGTALRPQDFAITAGRIADKGAALGEGNEVGRR